MLSSVNDKDELLSINDYFVFIDAITKKKIKDVKKRRAIRRLVKEAFKHGVDFRDGRLKVDDVDLTGV